MSMKRIVIIAVLGAVALGTIYLLSRATQNQWIAVAILSVCITGICVAVVWKPQAKKPARQPVMRKSRPKRRASSTREEPRYHQVAELMDIGYTVEEIADHLDITEEQVKSDLRYYKRKNEY